MPAKNSRIKVEKVLISKKTGKKYFVKDKKSDYISSEGIVKAKDLQSKKGEVKTDKGNVFYLLDPTFPDLFEKLERAPQIVGQKDIGLILAKTGANKDFVCVDAGAGSGSLSLALANVCKKVTCYDVNKAHLAVVEKNKDFFGATNLTVKFGDVAKAMTEKNLNLITLDLPHPWEMVERASVALKRGGHLVVYMPNLLQLKMFIDTCKGSEIKVIETIELLERNWKIENNILRPEVKMVAHTGFLTFCRKL